MLAAFLLWVNLPDACAQKKEKEKIKTIKVISSDSDKAVTETDTIFLTSENEDEEMIIINMVRSGNEVEATTSYATTGKGKKGKVITVKCDDGRTLKAGKGEACVLKSSDGKIYSIIIKEIDK
jgi:hypothetical protein